MRHLYFKLASGLLSLFCAYSASAQSANNTNFLDAIHNAKGKFVVTIGPIYQDTQVVVTPAENLAINDSITYLDRRIGEHTNVSDHGEYVSSGIGRLYYFMDDTTGIVNTINKVLSCDKAHMYATFVYEAAQWDGLAEEKKLASRFKFYYIIDNICNSNNKMPRNNVAKRVQVVFSFPTARDRAKFSALAKKMGYSVTDSADRKIGAHYSEESYGVTFSKKTAMTRKALFVMATNMLCIAEIYKGEYDTILLG